MNAVMWNSQDSHREKYHRAARDGLLDLLREATRRDCDFQDEDGMTPVQWAAFCGKLDALRLTISRGGNPNTCDFFGNTPLHHAAINGHLNCVTFLVNFGANIWMLDNNMQTALEHAAMGQHHEIVTYLDSIYNQQLQMNHRFVKKLREREVVQARKRAERLHKMQKKINIVEMRETDVNHASRSFFKSQNKNVPQNKVFSEHLSTKTSRKRVGGGVGVASKINRPLSSNSAYNRMNQSINERTFRRDMRDSNVLYGSVNPMTVNSQCTLSERSGRPLSEPDIYRTYSTMKGTNADRECKTDNGLFERPGFGSVAFFSRPVTSNILMTLPKSQDNTKEMKLQSKRQVEKDSIGTTGSLINRISRIPWTEEEVEALDDDMDERGTTLELFLACHGLTEYSDIFTKEKLDIESLKLCCEKDLIEAGLPLGPRRKTLDAIQRRRYCITQPGLIKDGDL